MWGRRLLPRSCIFSDNSQRDEDYWHRRLPCWCGTAAFVADDDANCKRLISSLCQLYHFQYIGTTFLCERASRHLSGYTVTFAGETRDGIIATIQNDTAYTVSISRWHQLKELVCSYVKMQPHKHYMTAMADATW